MDAGTRPLEEAGAAGALAGGRVSVAGTPDLSVQPWWTLGAREGVSSLVRQRVTPGSVGAAQMGGCFRLDDDFYEALLGLSLTCDYDPYYV